ncbi:MAG: glycosyltransferase [Pseudanabaenaceae cyanobacterium bins.68]|nr:glycosyltransferase [Pseudanabaenaceae cyanobacterium bins.68]
MVDLTPKLLSFIPADAQQVAQIGECAQLADRYRAINPTANYQVIAPGAALPENLDCLDCLVIPNLAAVENLAQYLGQLQPPGLVIGACPNHDYWQSQAHPPALNQEQVLQNLTAHLELLDLQADLDQATPAFSQFCQHLEQPDANRLLTHTFYFRASKTALTQPRLLIHTFISAPIGCDRVRVLEPDYFSATHPLNRTVQVRVGESISLNIAHPSEQRVLIWQRALLRYPEDLAKQKLLLKNGYLIVAEHDDDPYFWPENADHKFLLFWSSHCVQTSTPALAEHMRQWNPNVTVFANQLAYLPPPRQYPKTNRITLFFGALNRQADWEPIMPSLNQILRKFQQVSVQVVHDRAFFDALETKHKQFTPWCAYEQYQKILHSCDIGILPLNDTQFNRMKSDLKFLEHAGHGTVALASPVVYANSIIEGETGMIYHNLDQFSAKLTELIRNHTLRQAIATNAYQWVKQNRLMSQHYQARRQWYLEMRAQLPRLNAELRDRCPQLFS